MITMLIFIIMATVSVTLIMDILVVFIITIIIVIAINHHQRHMKELFQVDGKYGDNDFKALGDLGLV